MKNTLVIVLLLAMIWGCKKRSDDDISLYKWKRDLYRARVSGDGPAVFYSSDPKVSNNADAIFQKSDYITLTERRKNEQQDSIFNASGRTQIYKYEKQ